MPQLIRKIDDGSRWAYEYPEIEDAFPADPLGDLETEDNALSVFLVEDNISQKDIELALATNRNYLKPLHYAMLTMEDLEEKGFEIEDVGGDTKIEVANKAHRNLANLSANQLVLFARLMLKGMEKGNSKYLKPAEVKKLIKDGITEGKIKKEELPADIAKKLVNE